MQQKKEAGLQKLQVIFQIYLVEFSTIETKYRPKDQGKRDYNKQINKRQLTALALRDNTLTCHLREVRETRQNSKECQPQLQMIRSQGKNCSQWSSMKTGLYPFSEEGICLNEGYPPRTLKLTVLSGPTVKHKPLPQEQATHRGTDKNGWYTGEPRHCCTKQVPKRI